MIADREFSKVVKDALALCKAEPLVINYDDPEFTGTATGLAISNTRLSWAKAMPISPR